MGRDTYTRKPIYVFDIKCVTTPGSNFETKKEESNI